MFMGIALGIFLFLCMMGLPILLYMFCCRLRRSTRRGVGVSLKTREDTEAKS